MLSYKSYSLSITTISLIVLGTLFGLNPALLADSNTEVNIKKYNWQSLNAGNLKWDEEVGLWSSFKHGFNENEKDFGEVYDSRFNATNLLLAGRLGQLDDERITRVLSKLREMQDDRTGCMKFYYKDTGIRDGNISFFVCRVLILLKYNYSQQLSSKSILVLDDILQNLYKWLYSQSLEDNYFYLNKYLGDIVCAKLLQESYDMPQQEKDKLNQRMMEAAEYWQEDNWGWGEHLSDTYCGVSLDLIAQYLLFSKETSSKVYSKYQELFDELLAIGDMYDGGPRVPMIRSYSFSSRGVIENYRKSIKPWDDSIAQMRNHFWRESALVISLLYDNGWHERIASPQKKGMVNVTVPCFGDSVATSIIKSDIRLGSLSKFPVMPDAENIAWGIGWQSFPVVFWKPQGDWAFLQWQTVEDGQIKAHPANISTGARALTSKINPPIFGQTFSIQRGGDLLVVRRMPAIIKDWSMVSDVFKIVNSTAKITEDLSNPAFSQLLLKYPERTVSVCNIPLFDGLKPTTEKIQNATYWRLDYSKEKIEANQLENVLDIWAISLNGKITTNPVVTIEGPMHTPLRPQQRKRKLIWQWPETKWQVIIDPMSENPLQEIN